MSIIAHLFLLTVLGFPGSAPVGAPEPTESKEAAGSQEKTAEAAPTKDTAAAEVTAKKKTGKKKRKKRKRRRRCRTHASHNYNKMKRRWRKVPAIPKPKWRAGYRDLTLYAVNLGERVRVFPFLPDGTLDPAALEAITNVMRDKHTDETRPVHPRLVKLLYKLAVRFKARQITLISGFRVPKTEGSESHHTDGGAADFLIPGTRLPTVAKRARRLGHVGVGYYPTSGFVHLDVRDKPSYFWADPSGPGQPGCLRQIMKSAGFKFDRKWDLKDDEPVPQKNRAGELLGALPDPPENENQVDEWKPTEPTCE